MHKMHRREFIKKRAISSNDHDMWEQFKCARNQVNAINWNTQRNATFLKPLWKLAKATHAIEPHQRICNFLFNWWFLVFKMRFTLHYIISSCFASFATCPLWLSCWSPGHGRLAQWHILMNHSMWSMLERSMEQTCAILPISSVSFFTSAVVSSLGIVAGSVAVAIVRTSGAFIDI